MARYEVAFTAKNIPENHTNLFLLWRSAVFAERELIPIILDAIDHGDKFNRTESTSNPPLSVIRGTRTPSLSAGRLDIKCENAEGSGTLISGLRITNQLESQNLNAALWFAPNPAGTIFSTIITSGSVSGTTN
jgi:hypothetical protein